MKPRYFLYIFFLLLASCGVKGDPVPPTKDVEIGRGRPTFKKAFEKVKVPNKTYKDYEAEEDEEEKKKNE
jgi:hypothetical protein